VSLLRHVGSDLVRPPSAGGRPHSACLNRWARVSVAVAVAIVGSAPGPTSPASSVFDRRIYVSNEFGGSITVIDGATEKVINTIPIGPAGTARPRGMALSPDGSTLYVAVTDPWPNRPGSSYKFIWSIDAGTGRVRAKYRCGSDPERLAVTPDGRLLYCSNEDTATATAFALTTGKVIASIPVGIEPEGVGISPDGNWVYVTAETSNTVTVIDTKTKKPVRNVLVGERPRVVAFAPSGRRAYVSAETAGTLSVIDSTRHEVIKTVELGHDSKPVGVAVAPDGARVFVVGGRCNCLFIIDALRDAIIAIVTQKMGRRPWGVAVTADGKKIYTANGRSDDVSVVDAVTLRVVSSIGAGRGAHSVVISH
jgi:PQQ-dependent catabolism-associated beta-propeller protein